MALNENAQKWVNALRSGKYQQTQGHLRDKTGYCCLGVACEIYLEETGRGSWQASAGHNAYQYSIDPFERSHTSLPGSVRRWLGLQSASGNYLRKGALRPGSFSQRDNLATANDDGRDFEEIADIIESQPSGLFAP